METGQPSETVREAVGVFATGDTFEAAVDDLMSSGFDRAELSLLASERTVEATLGHRYMKVSEVEDDAAVPRRAYVSTESVGDAEGGLVGALLYVGAVAAAGAIVASGGSLAAAIAGAVLAGGAGGVAGSMLAALVGDAHARRIQEQIDHGGLLLWVRTRDADREKRAVDILKRHSGRDVHVHALPAE